MKKLSKKNTRLSRALDLHERRPPVCNVCLEGMLLPAGGSGVEGGVRRSGGGGGGGAPETCAAAVLAAAEAVKAVKTTSASAASRMAPGRASRVPFNLDEALLGPLEAGPLDGRGSSGGSGAVGGVLPLQVMAVGGEAVVIPSRDLGSQLEQQPWRTTTAAAAAAAGGAGVASAPPGTAAGLGTVSAGVAWTLGSKPAAMRVLAASGSCSDAAPKEVHEAGPVMARPGGVLRFPRRDVRL